MLAFNVVLKRKGYRKHLKRIFVTPPFETFLQTVIDGERKAPDFGVWGFYTTS
jgi:hypothetical protein